MDGRTDMASLNGTPYECESLEQAHQVIYKQLKKHIQMVESQYLW
jgi:hypothetical protein